MTTEPNPPIPQNSNRRLMRALGSGLSQRLCGTTLELLSAELLSLLAEADQRRVSSGPAPS
jgi:hypothetical protein